jgi:GNAT superfamily N-acetyltransferase
MEIRIRPALSTELPEMIALQNHALKTLCAKEYSSKQLTALVDDQSSTRSLMDELLFVADAEGQIVGFSSLLKMQPQIGAVYVHPNWVQQGIGTRLLDAVEQAALQRGIQKLWVMSSLTAVPFYQTQNYQFKRKIGFWTRSRVWIPCKLLEKRLVLTHSAKQARSQKALILILTIISLLGISFCQANSQLKQPIEPSTDQIEFP